MQTSFYSPTEHIGVFYQKDLIPTLNPRFFLIRITFCYFSHKHNKLIIIGKPVFNPGIQIQIRFGMEKLIYTHFTILPTCTPHKFLF